MKKLILLLAFPAILMSCGKSYFDINKNPNTPTVTGVTPNLVLPAALERTASSNVTNGSTLGAWMGYWSIGTNFGAVGEHRYTMGTDFGNGFWTNNYDIIFDYHSLQQKAAASGQDFYVGIAKIMKSVHYQMLVDLFNNIPYSKAMDFNGNITPAYDKGAEVYKDLLKQITEGINLIKNAEVTANPEIASADIMFHGNKSRWAQFGNTLKLRLLIHQSEVSGFSAAAEIAAINAEGSGFLGAGQTANVNPGYTTDKPNPFWSTYGFTTTGSYPNTYRRANNFALGLMTTLNDERLRYFYRAVRSGTYAGQYRGIDYGTNNDPGQIYYETNTSDIGGAPNASPTAAQSIGLAKAPTMDCWVITASESLFLQAEAAARGWTTGNARSLYEEGVRESFRWLGVTDAVNAANGYLAGANVRVAWPAATADQIKVIIWQKYFAFNGNNHFETWNDYKRTGVVQPAISVDPGKLTDHVPYRYPYPNSEYSYNAKHVQAEGTIDPYSQKVFWDN
ncbi:SusD/RagB family nutrient-binding outer membrane lipoprotein [Paraflavitalea sp. CAU 1676]|uniref:SusD/RagB family nutrient-binding outer membrane lipoprotein n=1 Tax=Paraflavitalea sp. CAU 1676 TaxID=3032598 RepID=UPI0023DAB4AD|nr:SusD/RagB family nutrient-binding outer membrane lipoprotein [Paraflavitalea sp. CAU 1676]MDF2193355.1 SusD/RagB family nutrient-binding outer membrane lipoprotein [Paraflavitalea sp. CAU 1676]